MVTGRLLSLPYADSPLLLQPSYIYPKLAAGRTASVVLIRISVSYVYREHSLFPYIFLNAPCGRHCICLIQHEMSARSHLLPSFPLSNTSSLWTESSPVQHMLRFPLRLTTDEHSSHLL